MTKHVSYTISSYKNEYTEYDHKINGIVATEFDVDLLLATAYVENERRSPAGNDGKHSYVFVSMDVVDR